MINTELQGKIQVKKTEIFAQKDPQKKSRLQQELQILNFRKQIDFYKNKITQIKNNMI